MVWPSLRRKFFQKHNGWKIARELARDSWLGNLLLSFEETKKMKESKLEASAAFSSVHSFHCKTIPIPFLGQG